MTAYYNEIDPYAAQWLRNLIDANLIAPGEVDERSIEDVRPDELMGFTQCHFFAGIGVWSYALRQAGWPDSKPVWTGSCPCQPFSAAGKGAGLDDERHLWPHFQWLIQQCRPPVVFGEQVASKAVEPWIDLVQADMEAMGYAFGAIPFPSAGVGAPHIRDRLFWVGHTDQPGSQGHTRHGGTERWEGSGGSAASTGVSGGLGDTGGQSGERNPGSIPSSEARVHSSGELNGCEPHRFEPAGSGMGGLADTDSERREHESGERPTSVLTETHGSPEQQCEPCDNDPGMGGVADTDGNGCDQTGQRISPTGGNGAERNRGPAADEPPAGPTNGFWGDADWLFCRDGKWRPVEPGTFPLAHGAASRVGRLRAYGNAINAQAAKVYIETARGILDAR